MMAPVIIAHDECLEEHGNIWRHMLDSNVDGIIMQSQRKRYVIQSAAAAAA